MRKLSFLLVFLLAIPLIAADTGWRGIFGTDSSPAYSTTFTGLSTSRTLKFEPSSQYNGDASLIVHATLNSGTMPTVTVKYRKYYAVNDTYLQYGPWHTLGTFNTAGSSVEFVVSKNAD